MKQINLFKDTIKYQLKNVILKNILEIIKNIFLMFLIYKVIFVLKKDYLIKVYMEYMVMINLLYIMFFIFQNVKIYQIIIYVYQMKE